MAELDVYRKAAEKATSIYNKKLQAFLIAENKKRTRKGVAPAVEPQKKKPKAKAARKPKAKPAAPVGAVAAPAAPAEPFACKGNIDAGTACPGGPGTSIPAQQTTVKGVDGAKSYKVDSCKVCKAVIRAGRKAAKDAAKKLVVDVAPAEEEDEAEKPLVMEQE